jgi:hypothetical protein
VNSLTEKGVFVSDEADNDSIDSLLFACENNIYLWVFARASGANSWG